MMPRFTPQAWLGKYRDLLLAITLFLVLDLGVLVFNFFTSQEIERDAAEINTAGELRMLSQQLAKALLTLDTELRAGAMIQTSMAQASESRSLFNSGLDKLANAPRSSGLIGMGTGGNGWEEREQMLTDLRRTWEPLNREAAALEGMEAPDASLVASAVTQAVTRNVKLMEQAADLTGFLEQTATNKASLMRRIQVAAITLATLNFIFIVFKFLRRLRASDREAELARAEVGNILATVHEGLFLLGRRAKIGSQRSASLDGLLGIKVSTGDPLPDLLKKLIPREHLEATNDYIDLLFNRKIKASLLAQLNPLREIEIVGGDFAGKRFLTFEFDQIRHGEDLNGLLVTVTDVTQKVTLERELAGAEARAKNEVELLLGVLDQDPNLVAEFLHASRQKIDLINTELQQVRPNAMAYTQLVSQVARNVHTIKGEAAALSIPSIERFSHDFEGELTVLRGRRDLSGDDLIPVAVRINELLEQILRVEAIIDRVRRFVAPADMGATTILPPAPLRTLLEPVEHLALRVAEDLNKKVDLEIDVPPLLSIPDTLRKVCREILPQLVRNAVAHGIETEPDRVRAGKPATGRLVIRIDADGENACRLSVRDDGRGLSPAWVRNRLVSKGWRSAEEVARMTDEEVLATLFEPGFSALDEANLHAGRGDGLAAVKDLLNEVGGRLRVLSRPNAYTEFVVQVSA